MLRYSGQSSWVSQQYTVRSAMRLDSVLFSTKVMVVGVKLGSRVGVYKDVLRLVSVVTSVPVIHSVNIEEFLESD